VLGGATAVIRNGAHDNTVNTYAFLDYGAPIKRLGGTFSYSQFGATFNKTNAGVTIAACGSNTLNDLLHLQMGAGGGTLTKGIAGGAFVGIGSTMGWTLLSNSIYYVAMKIDNTNNTITVYAPDGNIYKWTDADIGTTLVCNWGFWQLSNTPVTKSVAFR
jgi:hypothetical protein